MKDDVAALICGNVDDLRNHLRGGETDRGLIERAIAAARTLREGKTKVALLEAHLRRMPAPTSSIQPMSSKKTTALALITETQIPTTGRNLTDLQRATLQQLALIAKLENEAAFRAVVTGLGLHAIKAQLKHGEFGPWLEKNAGAGRAQCNFYMKLALAFVEKSKVTKPELLAAAQGGFEMTVREGAAGKFVQRIGAFIGDHSLNELLIKHGVKGVGLRSELANEDASETGGETTTAGEQMFFSDIASHFEGIRAAILKPEQFARLDPKQLDIIREELEATRTQFLKLYNEARKSRK